MVVAAACSIVWLKCFVFDAIQILAALVLETREKTWGDVVVCGAGGAPGKATTTPMSIDYGGL